VAVFVVLAVAVLGLLRAAHPASPPSLDQRVAAVAATLRCPTCAGLSVQDSTSVLAAGSRQVIRQQLAEGRTPDQVRQWFVDRYGEQVLLAPDPGGPGLLAWLLPALAVPVAGALVWRWTRRSRAGDGAALSGADAAEAAAALAAWHEGRLDPQDGTPAGDALHAALLARIAAEEDGACGSADAEVVRADRRLAAAHRRFAARAVAAPSRPADPVTSRAAGRARASRRVRTVARRPVAVGAFAVLAVVGGAAVALTVHARGPGSPAVGASPAAATAAAGAPPGMPAVPPGWTGGMPQTAAQWVALGRAYDKAHQLPQATAAYGMALRLEPGADDVLLLRADVLVRSGQAATALPDLQQLDQRHPDSPDVLLILGLAQNRTGAPAATATLQRFLQLAPDSPAAPGVRKLLGAG
jgi:cytochrome c-type biogenesis protein CcmH